MSLRLPGLWPPQLAVVCVRNKAGGTYEEMRVKTTGAFVRGLIQFVLNLTRSCYRMTVVRGMNNSRRRRGLPALDQRGRRSLLTLTVALAGFIALVGMANAMATPQRTADQPTIVRPAPRTFTPLPTATQPTPAATYSPAPLPEVDVDDHVNLPDGALTGGYCARKWWC